MKQIKIKNKILFWVFFSLSLAFMGLIFYFSSQPAELSQSTSNPFAFALIKLLFKNFQNYSPARQERALYVCSLIVRKAAHFSVYFLLGATLKIWHLQIDFKNKWLNTFLPLGIGVLYAVSDEIHQLFVMGRSGQITDVLLDSAGVLIGTLLALLVVKAVRKNIRKKQLHLR